MKVREHGRIGEFRNQVITGVNALRCRRDQTIVLSGYYRSGTSWLGEVLSRSPGYMLSFEPLRSNYNPDARFLRAECQFALEPDLEHPRACALMEAVLTGRSGSQFSAYEGSRLRSWWKLATANRLIVKFVRGSRLLAWLCRTFPDVPRPVHIVRHPCAVVASQLAKKSHAWRDEGDADPLERFRPLSDAQLEAYGDVLASVRSPVEVRAAHWAVHLETALRQRPDGSWLIRDYESLVRGGSDSIVELTAALGMPVPRRLDRLREPSDTMVEEQIQAADVRLNKWRSQLDADDARRVLDVVHAIGVGLYADESPRIDIDWLRRSHPDLVRTGYPAQTDDQVR